MARSVHVDYQQQPKPYHLKVAALVEEICPSDGLILDAGCGVGHTLRMVQERVPGARLFGADIDDECLEKTASRVELEASFQVDGFAELGRHAVLNNCDVVILSHVLEHIAYPKKAIHELMDLLKPGGFLVVAVPNPVRPSVFVKAILRSHYVNRGHAQCWDRSHWINFLEEILDLDVVHYDQDFVPLPFVKRVGPIRWLEEKLAHVVPWLAFSNIAVVRKAKKRG